MKLNTSIQFSVDSIDVPILIRPQYIESGDAAQDAALVLGHKGSLGQVHADVVPLLRQRRWEAALALEPSCAIRTNRAIYKY